MDFSNSSDDSNYGLHAALHLMQRKRNFENIESTSSSTQLPQYRSSEHSYEYCLGSTDDDLADSWNTFSNGILLNTQDISESSIRSSNAPQCDESESNLKMELLMMRKNLTIMPNTSSPIFKRRGLPFTNYIEYTPPSDTYCEWRKNLHEKRIHSFHNITNLPEAVTGQFGSLPYPAKG